MEYEDKRMKGIITINVPKNCFHCDMCFQNAYNGEFLCYFNLGYEIKQDGKIPDWCPIKPLPEKMKFNGLKTTKTASYVEYVFACPVCGENVRQKDKYCSYCGHKLEE